MKRKHLNLSLRWKFLFLISAIFLTLGMEWRWQFDQILSQYQQNLGHTYQNRFQRLVKNTLNDARTDLEILALLVYQHHQKSPNKPLNALEAPIITKDVVAVIQQTPHQTITLYQEPNQSLPDPKTHLSLQNQTHLSCRQKICYLQHNFNSYDLQGHPIHLSVIQKASYWFDQIRLLLDNQHTVIVLNQLTQQRINPLISNNNQLLHTIWPKLQTQFSPSQIDQNRPHSIKAISKGYLLIPLQMPIAPNDSQHFQLWAIQNITKEIHTWQNLKTKSFMQMGTSWLALMLLLLIAIHHWLKSLHQVEKSLVLAARKKFKKAAKNLMWTKRPLLVDELHNLHLLGRKMFLRMGRLTDQLEWMAYHDTLTGLPNRRSFYQFLQHFTQQKQGALLFLDLNHFKQINDVYGHKVGDVVLTDLTHRLTHLSIAYTHKAFRLAGDEFILFLNDTIGRQALIQLLNQLTDQLEGTVTTDNGEIVYYQTSIGAVLLDHHTDLADGDTLLHWADIAMYKAKHESSTLRWYLFNPLKDDDASTQKQELKLVSWMRKALDQQTGFQLVAQPIAQITPQSIQRYEVLLRLQDKEGTPISPADFIPVAERHGLIYEIDLWVFEQAMNALSQIAEPIRFSINLSAPSLQRSDLAQTLLTLVDTYQIPTHRIVVELTETAYIQNLTQVKNNLLTLKSAGIQLALDDFGTGYTSFQYLTDLGFDYIKLDGLFIKDLNENQVHHAFVKGVTEIVQASHMQVIAEFVENGELLQTLKALKVNYAQGWHIGKPQPIETLFNASKRSAD